MAFDDPKIAGNQLTADEYNDLVNAAKHILAQDTKHSIFDSDENPNYIFKTNGVRAWSLSYSSNVSILTGGNAAGDDLKLAANSQDVYPYLQLPGADSVQLRLTSTKSLLLYAETSIGLVLTPSTTASIIQGPPSTTNTLTLAANQTDAYPKILLTGNGSLALYAGTTIDLYDGAVNYGQFDYSTDFQIKSMQTNQNIALVPNGTGKVKFGAYTGTVKSIIGYIDILDSGGTARRLAVVAASD